VDVLEPVERSRRVPLISWNRAGTVTDSVDPDRPENAEEWLECPRRNCGPKTFAIRVAGESMEPLYQHGDIIYVDPDVVAEHGKDVLVRLDDRNDITFKRLVIEDERRYLKPLNTNWPVKFIDIPASARVVGVVIGKWVDIS
jgi:SOS-response transcriptional repressor LexA